jgi:hypothetical protein
MKGMIFTEFLDMVEGAHGMALTDRVIARAGVGGAYTSVGNYPPGELLAMVGALSAETGVPVADLEVAFGKRIFEMFTRKYGRFFAQAGDSFRFLSGIENYIHVEVRKLYPDAELPQFSYPQRSDSQLVMDYRSSRPLADFAFGLIQATIEHYREAITVTKQPLPGADGTAARFTLTRA